MRKQEAFDQYELEQGNFDSGGDDQPLRQCPKCLSAHLCPSRRHGTMENLMAALGGELLRCHVCNRRTAWFGMSAVHVADQKQEGPYRPRRRPVREAASSRPSSSPQPGPRSSSTVDRPVLTKQLPNPTSQEDRATAPTVDATTPVNPETSRIRLRVVMQYPDKSETVQAKPAEAMRKAATLQSAGELRPSAPSRAATSYFKVPAFKVQSTKPGAPAKSTTVETPAATTGARAGIPFRNRRKIGFRVPGQPPWPPQSESALRLRQPQ